MRKEKRGLSAIVITLIIIMLSLVAVGVVWAVVNNLIKSGTEGVSLSAKCLNMDIRATAVLCNSGKCNVTVQRTGTEADDIGGIKLVFRDSTAGNSSSLIDESGNIEVLVGKKVENIGTGLTAPDKVEVTAYFKDESDNEQLCQQTTYFEF